MSSYCTIEDIKRLEEIEGKYNPYKGLHTRVQTYVIAIVTPSDLENYYQKKISERLK